MNNQVLITGKLGANPEVVRTKEDGGAVTKMSIALNEYRFNEEEDFDKVRTSWIPVTVFGEIAEKSVESLKSGDQVTVMGALRSSQYEKDGEKRSRLEVIARSILMSQNLPMTDHKAMDLIEKKVGVEPKTFAPPATAMEAAMQVKAQIKPQPQKPVMNFKMKEKNA